MLNICVLCVGKLKEPFYTQAAAEYEKRLFGYCKLTLTELPEEKLPDHPSRGQIAAALEKEGESLVQRIPKGAVAAALCVEGRLLSSEDLSQRMTGWMVGGRSSLAFLIGSSHGMAQSVKDKCDLRLSMSPMTFPHHLARVMLLEQIYRAFKIQEGSSYHK